MSNYVLSQGKVLTIHGRTQDPMSLCIQVSSFVVKTRVPRIEDHPLLLFILLIVNTTHNLVYLYVTQCLTYIRVVFIHLLRRLFHSRLSSGLLVVRALFDPVRMRSVSYTDS